LKGCIVEQKCKITLSGRSLPGNHRDFDLRRLYFLWDKKGRAISDPALPLDN
jgi:hypothetical protein